MTWADSFLRTLKENDVRLVTYVPDNVLTPLINGAAADNYFMSIGATREDEAVGTLAFSFESIVQRNLEMLSMLEPAAPP